MARRLNWEKARRDDRMRRQREWEPRQNVRVGRPRELVLESFVKKHQLDCFECGTNRAVWAKTGISARGPWAICAPCARKSKKDKAINGD